MLPTFQQAADADVHDTPPVCGPRRRLWGAAYSYEKVREQARIQVQGRSQGQVIYETLRSLLALAYVFFRLSGLSAEDLLDERAGLSGLIFVANAGGTAAAPVHRYRFPQQ